MLAAATAAALLSSAATAQVATSAGTAGADPQHIRLGLESLAGTADPHLYNSLDNANLAAHLFEPLVRRDRSLQPIPGLATKWQADDERTWTFVLRQGVQFHNGTALDAQDVVYSFCRILALPGSGFRGALRGITSVEAKDAGTVVLRTVNPDPLVPRNLTSISIIAAPEGWSGKYDPNGCRPEAWPATAEFDRGTADLGSGPFRLTKFEPGRRIELARFDGYWGAKPSWNSVAMVPLPDPGARGRALISGTVDIVNAVSAESFPFFAGLPNLHLVSSPQARTLVLNLNQRSGAIGTTGAENPFSDPRVRRAISYAIDRRAISERLMLGTAVPAGQLIPQGMFGFDPDLPDNPYDPDRARALLAEAGYAGGFDAELMSIEPMAKLSEVVARYLSTIGIRTRVSIKPAPEAMAQLAKLDFQMQVGGTVPLTGEFGYTAREALATRDPPSGMGTQNYGGYSNPELDQLIRTALVTIDDGKRLDLLKTIGRIAMTDVPKVPILHLPRTWAMRSGLIYEGRAEGMTLAHEITKGDVEVR